MSVALEDCTGVCTGATAAEGPNKLISLHYCSAGTRLSGTTQAIKEVEREAVAQETPVAAAEDTPHLGPKITRTR